MSEKTLFYAWQNDTLPKCNRYFIHDVLGQALRVMEREERLEECPRLDHDTLGIPGTPSIADAIFEKISRCLMFVADVTFVCREKDKRLPNSNVLIELGYALHAISSDRIVLIMNETYGMANELPFDLRHRRFPIRYSLSECTTKEERNRKKTELVEEVKQAVRAVFGQKAATTGSARQLEVRVNPTRSGNRQLAQIRLFNPGPGPVYVDHWWAQWGPEGKPRGFGSIETFEGSLPLRLQEQDAATLVVEIGDNVECLTAIGVVDGERHFWTVDENQLRAFIRNAIHYRQSPIVHGGGSQVP